MIFPTPEVTYCFYFIFWCLPDNTVNTRGFSCHYFPSLVERQELCRCKSGLTGVATLSLCSTCFPSSPSRYALGVDERCGKRMASQWQTIRPLRLRLHQQFAPSSFALSH